MLSLHVLGHARRMGFSRRILHVQAANQDLALLAQFNDLCEAVWIKGQNPPPLAMKAIFLSLFHDREAMKDLKKIKAPFSLGPRSKISSLWSYSMSVRQSRSQVLKSEGEYNLDLLNHLGDTQNIAKVEWMGLPALKLPQDWRSPVISPDIVINVSNRGSAANWSIDKYISLGMEYQKRGVKVDFVVSGEDEVIRMAKLKAAQVEKMGCRILPSFENIKQLCRYLSEAKHVISSSTGTLHLAHALGVEVTGIYPMKKVESFERWQPYGFWHSAPVRFIEI